jgi:hypothetical protein
VDGSPAFGEQSFHSFIPLIRFRRIFLHPVGKLDAPPEVGEEIHQASSQEIRPSRQKGRTESRQVCPTFGP